MYPANWLRLASPAQREAIGITEVPDPAEPIYDQRFYWGYTASGTLIPKDHSQLVTNWVDQTRTTANTLLSPSDWTIVRLVDNGAPVPSGIQAWRQDIRTCCNDKVSSIETTVTTDELATYITGSGYPNWPPQEQPIVANEPSADYVTSSVIFNGVSGSNFIDGSSLYGAEGVDTVIL